jgi:hypothetical protein
MRPPARPWSRRFLIAAALLLVLVFPQKPVKIADVTPVVTSYRNTAQVKSGPPFKRDQRALGLVLALAVLLQSGHQ